MAPLILAGRWRWQPTGRLARAESGIAASRRRLQVCLGLLWLIDAALQFQPSMFGPFFVIQTIQPVAAGNPAVVASSVTWASRRPSHCRWPGRCPSGRGAQSGVLDS